MKAQNFTETSRASYLSAQRYMPEDYNLPLRSLALQVALYISKEFQNSCYEMAKKNSIFVNEAGRRGVRNVFYAAHEIKQGPAKTIYITVL